MPWVAILDELKPGHVELGLLGGSHDVNDWTPERMSVADFVVAVRLLSREVGNDEVGIGNVSSGRFDHVVRRGDLVDAICRKPKALRRRVDAVGPRGQQFGIVVERADEEAIWIVWVHDVSQEREG